MKYLIALLALVSTAWGATTLAPGTYTVASCPVPPPVVPPPVTPPVTPPVGTFWVYHNGVFNWPGDFSWNATINYKDKGALPAGVSVSSSTAIGVSIIGQWGGWQPYGMATPTSSPFDTRPYKYLQYCTQPTQAGEIHGSGIDADNDVADGTPIQIVAGPNTTKYGPVPMIGKWGCYKIPLADFGLTNPFILKFSVTDGTGNVPNKFYVNDVAFTAN